MYDIEAVNGVSKMCFLFLSIPKLQQRNRWSLVMDFIPSFIIDVFSYPVIKNSRLKSPAWRLFTQPSIQTQIEKKISKLRVTGLLCGEFTGVRWISRTIG